MAINLIIMPDIHHIYIFVDWGACILYGHQSPPLSAVCGVNGGIRIYALDESKLLLTLSL